MFIIISLIIVIDGIPYIRSYFIILIFLFLIREAAVQILKKAEMMLVGVEKKSQGINIDDKINIMHICMNNDIMTIIVVTVKPIRILI